LSLKPSILVVSLWRAYAVGLVYKLLRPNTKLVLFLHLPAHVHLLDHIFTRLTAHFAAKVWADSHQTLCQRVPNLLGSRGRVISFITARISPVTSPTSARPVFIYWGRIQRQKGLKHAVNLFARVCEHRPDALFVIIGPDCGELSSLQQQVADLDLSDNVQFRGAMDFHTICSEAQYASFYLQTSILEGMSMSVVEAMQLGLVPVVSPVGEIANYARNGINSLHVVDAERSVSDILSVLSDNNIYKSLRAGAIDTWSSARLYKEDILEACNALIC